MHAFRFLTRSSVNHLTFNKLLSAISIYCSLRQVLPLRVNDVVNDVITQLLRHRVELTHSVQEKKQVASDGMNPQLKKTP